MLRHTITSAILLLVLFVSGCDEGSLLPPDVEDPMFSSYVAIGNSITAGFQSNGINQQTQLESYTVDLAEDMNTEFNLPLLNMPGCPPPLVNPLTGERLAAVECAFRDHPVPAEIHNVAVPGAEVIDVLDNLADDPFGSNANELTTLLLGGQTQLQAAAEADPTFVSAWIGNNDVLGAALAGEPALITPVQQFQQRYSNMIDSLEAMGVQGGLLVGVADVRVAPHFSGGLAYYMAEQAGAFQQLLNQAAAQGANPGSFDVADNCGPTSAGGVGEASLVPFSYGFGELVASAIAGADVTLDCTHDRILLGEEIVAVATATAQYNAFIQQTANDLGWAYYSANPTLTSLKDAGEVPQFPDLASPQNLFGDYFSLDGIHPSGLAHTTLAVEMAAAIDATYGTNLAEGDETP